jgi:N-acetyldiaminopimelate deacetylase
MYRGRRKVNEKMNWVNIRRTFHEIPELGFEEFETQKQILEYIRKFKTDYIEIKQWRTGVILKINGTVPKKTIGFRCDIDGLPIEEKTGVEFTSKNKGKMHACGHDFHITFGLQMVYLLSQKRPKNNIVVIFQPAEEGPGGAELLIKENRDEVEKIDKMFSFHIEPDLKTGVIGWNKKEMFSGAMEFDLVLKAKGGHAAIRTGVKDLTEVTSELYLESLKRNKEGENVLHIGLIQSGQARNSFPTKVTMSGTIRSYKKERFEKEFEFIKYFLKEKEVEFELIKGPYYPPVINNEELTMDLLNTMNTLNKKIEKRMTAEDFGWYSDVTKTTMFWIGAKSISGLHTESLNPDEKVLEKSAEILEKIIESVAY